MDIGTLAFVERALALKEQPRRGWLRAGVARPESVADHSWGVALLAVAFAETRPDLDRARLLELAIMHDVCEVATGDLVPGEYHDKAEKLAREREGLETLLDGAPLALRTRLLARFEELATDATPEARAIHELDKLEMALQAEAYEVAGVPAEGLTPFRESAARGISDARLRDVLERLARRRGR